jgi:predicted outer membrane repeat protein
MKTRIYFTTTATVVLVAFLFAGISVAEDFTLSDNALMTMLNQTNEHVWSTASIVEKRDVPGPGVEFDIYFPSTKPGESHFECVATKKDEPNNPLFASDLRVFDAFALKFTLLAVDGDASPNHKGHLGVGSYINMGYRPASVTLSPEDTNTTVSRTRVGPDDVFSIGITINLITSEGWDPNGTTITLLVEPAPEAVALPKTPESKPRNITGKIIYVDTAAAGSNNGSSWADAYKSLQDALTIAAKGDEIWVARGTYKPNQGKQPDKSERAATFTLKSGVAIYGGFPAGGSRWEDCNPVVNETILSGDLKGDDVKVNNPQMLLTDPMRSDNATHVVTASGANETALLDGFTIVGGNAGGSQLDTANQGGGLYAKAGSPTITNCIFKLNSAELGGAVYFWSGSPVFINCRFIDNYAGSCGGAMHNTTCNPILVNCVFNRNSANEKGGAIYNEANKADIINCTIIKNYAYAGGGVYNQKSTPTITNCILWGNTSRYGADEPAQLYGVKVEVGNCCIQGLTEQLGGKNCFSKDPQITDPDTNGCHLSAGSPCIDAGDSKILPDDVKTDIDGNRRISGAAVDIGAIEVR